jgi:hypothetical protein
MSPRRTAVWLAAMAPFAFVASAGGAPGATVTVERNAFRVALPDGRVLTQAQLPGVILTLGDGSGAERRIRIDAVEPDSRDPSGETLLYTLSEQDAAGGWTNACLPDPDGRRLGFPLPGAFDAAGHYDPTHPGILITCTAGAEGKCVRFGYKPWRRAADGTSLEAAYNACVRLVRADYSGDGRGTTRNGQPIDIYDAFGVQSPTNDPAYEFEAGFTAGGAVCVRHVRVKENATLAGIAAASPRLFGRVGDVCTEAFARDAGAILFVRSPP